MFKRKRVSLKVCQSTRRKQFRQSCWKILAEVQKVSPLVWRRQKKTKLFSKLLFLPQSVPVDMYNALVAIMPEKPFRKVETFSAVCKSYYNIPFLIKKQLSWKCFSGLVKCLLENRVENFFYEKPKIFSPNFRKW